MNKTLNITLFALIGLTVCSAFISNSIETFVTSGIIGLAVLKFIGVSLHFYGIETCECFLESLNINFFSSVFCGANNNDLKNKL